MLLADQVKSWRFRNQVRILQKAEKIIDKKNIPIKEVPLKILVPLLEKSSLEENEDLQNKWVGLLVNYVDSRKKYRSTIFPSLLSELSTNEIKCLDYFNLRTRKESNTIIRFEDIPNNLEIYGVELSNLIRLGLIGKMPPNINILPVELPLDGWDPDITPNATYHGNDLRYQMTELGVEFLKACRFE